MCAPRPSEGHPLSIRFLRSAAALLSITILIGAVGLGAPSAAAAEPVAPADAALDWLASELAANDGMLTVTFGTDVYPDPGLTIDAVLAEVAGGRGGDAAVATAVGALDGATFDYVNQFSAFPLDRAANATAKALLLQEILDTDLGDTVDLESDLRALMATTGDEIGRFNDTDLQGYGNYSNGLGQALALLALDRTTGGAPTDAISFLLDQQCSDGSFRLYYFGYVTSFDPFETVGDLTCSDPAEGDIDATALALDALLAVSSSPAVTVAAKNAADFLLGAQEASGGFSGTGAINANSTGLAGQALRAAGQTSDADAAAGFLAGLQMLACADFGALAYDATGFAAGVEADRDQWIRATAQGVLGLGLPSYGSIGSVAPVNAGLDPVACPVVVVPTVVASAASVSAGGALTLSAVGFDANETVDITLRSTPISLGFATAGADGAVEATVTIPADIEPGQHRIELVGRTSGTTVSVDVEVVAVAAPLGTTLPITGRHTGAEASVALALLVIGGALVGGGRRRRASLAEST